MTHDPVRLALAVLLVAGWIGLCLGLWWRQRRAAGGGGLLIAFASQTGFAADIARRTADPLAADGVATRLLPLGQVTAADLAQATDALFVVSTTGEGDAPDPASRFLRGPMAGAVPLARLHYAVLALGDRAYPSYCAFGHALDRWLKAQGARPAADLIEVDDGDPAALRQWQERLALFGAGDRAADWAPPVYARWQLAARTCLNPGSPGGPVHHLRLVPLDDAPEWTAGAIAEIYPGPAGAAASGGLPHRAYSVASLPSDGAVELVVRRVAGADGRPGLGSGWLCAGADVGDTVALRLRDNPAFAPPPASIPMILIGNGTGIAGLRAHLKARDGAAPAWLLFGERTAAHDAFFDAELRGWQADGRLTRLDRAFSWDGGADRYVQHLLARHAADVRDWVGEGAVLYVCGSLAGMAAAVDAALADTLGRAMLDDMTDAGRYRRDVY